MRTLSGACVRTLSRASVQTLSRAHSRERVDTLKSLRADALESVREDALQSCRRSYMRSPERPCRRSRELWTFLQALSRAHSRERADGLSRASTQILSRALRSRRLLSTHPHRCSGGACLDAPESIRIQTLSRVRNLWTKRTTLSCKPNRPRQCPSQKRRAKQTIVCFHSDADDSAHRKNVKRNTAHLIRSGASRFCSVTQVRKAIL